MKVCSKCKVERNEDEYYTYWHSTQQKYRTRKVCTHCTKKQSREYKLNRKAAVIEEQVPKKYCPNCKKDVPLSNYYNGMKENGKYCITCVRIISQQKAYNKAMENGGSERVCKNPNEYPDQFQKAQVFMVLERLGWVFNEDTQIWSKEGVKTKDNVWLNIKPQPKTKRRPNGVIVRKKHGVHNYIKEIMELREEGTTYEDLAYIYCCSHTTIRKIVNDYYREKRDG